MDSPTTGLGNSGYQFASAKGPARRIAPVVSTLSPVMLQAHGYASPPGGCRAAWYRT
jgi:hypothetical protein